LSSRLWQPLGAADAYVWLNAPGGSPRCYSSLLARPIDWLRTGLLIKDRGRIGGRRVVPPDWIDAMIAASPANPNYGMQIWMAAPFTPLRFYNQQRSGYSVRASAPSLAPDLVFMDGFGGQRVYVSRRHDFVIVRLGQMQQDWDDAVLPNLVSRVTKLGRR
jgi:CubicO group peptidase (beta-lactamase class C family)